VCVHSRRTGARGCHLSSSFRPCRSSRLRRFTPHTESRVCCTPLPTMGSAWFRADRRLTPTPDPPHRRSTLRSVPLSGSGSPRHWEPRFPLTEAPTLSPFAPPCSEELDFAAASGLSPPKSPLLSTRVATRRRLVTPLGFSQELRLSPSQLERTPGWLSRRRSGGVPPAPKCRASAAAFRRFPLRGAS